MDFPVGSLVRLRNGWTIMQVIGHRSDGKIIAKYAHLVPVLNNDFYQTDGYNTQIRYPNQFVHWEGRITPCVNTYYYKKALQVSRSYIKAVTDMKKPQMKKDETTPQQYILKTVRGNVPAVIGVKLDTLNNGNVVMRMTDDSIRVEHPDNIREYTSEPKPTNVWLVKKVNSNYFCAYSFPSHCYPSEYMLSASGNLYERMHFIKNVGNHTVKGNFIGRMLDVRKE